MASFPGDEHDRPTRAMRGGGDDSEHQQVMQRRAIAGGVIVLFLILVLLLAKGCQSSRQTNAIKEFVKQTNSIVTQSNQTSKDFFAMLNDPGDASATDIETSVNVQRSQASELVRQAADLKASGENLQAAKQYLVDTLEFRRDGLTAISKEIGQALGDQDPDAATEKIAANMQQFLTSDVIYSQRAYAYMNAAVKDKKIEGVELPASQFLPSLEWLDPAQVSDAFSRISGSSSDETATPGTHGTGITGVTAQPSGTALTDGATADLNGASSIEVDVQNQGENDETNVVVSYSITGSGSAIKQNKTIPSIKAGETTKVTLPLTKIPASGATATMKVSVKKVAGEQNLDNNSQTFQVTF
ncbi:MAG: CARDB domain-containing protein [Solirubrobacterales bacterium]